MHTKIHMFSFPMRICVFYYASNLSQQQLGFSSVRRSSLTDCIYSIYLSKTERERVTTNPYDEILPWGRTSAERETGRERESWYVILWYISLCHSSMYRLAKLGGMLARPRYELREFNYFGGSTVKLLKVTGRLWRRMADGERWRYLNSLTKRKLKLYKREKKKYLLNFSHPNV